MLSRTDVEDALISGRGRDSTATAEDGGGGPSRRTVFGRLAAMSLNLPCPLQPQRVVRVRQEDGIVSESVSKSADKECCTKSALISLAYTLWRRPPMANAALGSSAASRGWMVSRSTNANPRSSESR